MAKAKHKVWQIMSKERYTKEGQKQVEEMFDDMEQILGKLENAEVCRLFKYYDEMNSEFFDILSLYTQYGK